MHSDNKTIPVVWASLTVIIVLALLCSFVFALTPSTLQAGGYGGSAAAQSMQKSVGDPSNTWSTTLAEWISNIVYVFTVGLMSAIAYVCAYFFDLAVHLALQGPIYALDFVEQGWTWARDLANIAFIFILIYLAFIIMLEANTTDTMKTLAYVVVVALLINFSFFLTRVVVDAGNLLSVQFYNAICAPPMAGGSVTCADGTVVSSTAAVGVNSTLQQTVSAATGSYGASKDLTASIMGALKMQSILSSEAFNKFSVEQTGLEGFLVKTIVLCFIYIAIGIMFGLLAGSFLFAGAKFLIRIVALWFLIIASPAAFITATLQGGPKNKRGLFSQWLNHLIHYSFYPVVYLFIFLILTKFMNTLSNDSACSSSAAKTGSCLIDGIFNSLQNVSDQTSFIAAIGAAIATVAIRLGFVVTILYVALSVSDILIKEGNAAAQKFSSWAGNAVAGGALGWAGRTVIGRGLGGALNLNRGTAGVGTFLQNRSYDPRNLPGLGRVAQSGVLGQFGARTPAFPGGLPVDFGAPPDGRRWFGGRRQGRQQPPAQPSGGPNGNSSNTPNPPRSTPAAANASKQGNTLAPAVSGGAHGAGGEAFDSAALEKIAHSVSSLKPELKQIRKATESAAESAHTKEPTLISEKRIIEHTNNEEELDKLRDTLTGSLKNALRAANDNSPHSPARSPSTPMKITVDVTKNTAPATSLQSANDNSTKSKAA